MFISNFGGNPVTQLNVQNVKTIIEVAPFSECDYN